MLEFGLFLTGWQSLAATEDPFVGFAGGNSPLFVEAKSGKGERALTTARNKLRWFNDQSFQVEKAANTYRIFCLGGSTTYGHPYDDATSFAGWLRELLPEWEPALQWEVVNCGGISYASYRVAKLMQELVEHEPDLFVIYTGHNEFLEARTYEQLKKASPVLLWLAGLASHTRSYTVASKLIEAVRGGASNDSAQNLLPGEVSTLLDSAVGLEVYHRDDEQQQLVYEHFELNLRRMVEMARQSGAEVILISPASNLAQCAPFKSENKAELKGAALLEWQAAFDEAERLFTEGKFAAAVPAINRAVELDNRHAATLYLRGRILHAMGESKRAKIDFVRARDEDICCLRAPQPIIDIVRKTAHDMNVPLVDFVQWTEESTEDAIPGDALFLDHVHATIDSYQALALQILETMAEQDLVAGKTTTRTSAKSTTLSDEVIAQANKRVHARIDSAQHGVALRNISKVYSWAGKKEDADRIALRALELIPDDPDTIYQAANAHVRLGNIDEGIRLYQRILELMPSYAAAVNASLGFAYAAKGDEDKCIEYYEKALALNPDYSDIHYNLATVFERRGELSDAEEHYTRAITGNEYHYMAQYRLGLVYSLQEKWEAARDQFIRSAELNPTAIEPHLGLGQVMAIMGDPLAARQQFQWVLERAPGNVDAQQELQRLKQR